MTLTSQQTSILANARAQLGKRYLFGGKGPDEFDCSGLTSWVYQHGGGITLDAGTVGQLHDGMSIVATGANWSWSKVVPLLQPCDLVFPGPDHVQLWTGSDVIEAANSSSPVHEVPEWAPSVYAVRRVLSGPSQPPGGAAAWDGRYLYLTTPPAPYMTGEDVRAWQRALIAAGHPCGTAGADGIYGRDTNAATVAWAKAKGIPDSTEPWIVGPHDWQVMFG